jgi:hypothetical protein
MQYRLSIAPEVEQDIVSGIDWYNLQLENLGFEFEQAIYEAIEIIVESTLHFQIRYDVFRICFLKRFPYGIHYTIEKNVVKIVMVVHAHRNPVNWKERIKRKK